MARSSILLALGCVSLAGCGHGTLVPSKTATVIPGTDGAAFVVADGVRCTAEAGAWEGRPDDLPASIAPLKVRIRNESDEPVRVRYEDFALVGKHGRKYLPLPLVPLDRPAGLTINPIYAADKFFVAPRLHDAYPTLAVWSSPLPRDQAVYERQYAKWGTGRPGRHVLREGLPEGMLDAGGTITGFLYFESPVGREDRAVFEASLERGGADDGHATSLRIPFRVD